MYKTVILGLLGLIGGSVATTIHVNEGCIDVNNSPLCHPGTEQISSGSATFAGRFDSGNVFSTAVPGCLLNANWPTSYGDIFYGADDCLYDAHGENINGQCCEPGTGGSSQIPNPYA